MTETVRPAAGQGGLEPTRDPRVTLPDLLEVLLNKGVYLNLDAIITVADIPLLGINLRATIAGIETMLEYGMMRSWDERTRAWVQRSVSRQVPLASGEELVAKMAGGHYLDSDFGAVWRPGTLYLTTRRLIAFRRDPREVLWESALTDIHTIDLHAERVLSGEERQRLAITTTAGDRVLLSAAAPERLSDLVRTQAGDTRTVATTGTRMPLLQSHAWYREERAGGHMWRGGTASLDEREGLSWKGALDVRPAVRIRPEALDSVTVDRGRTPTGDSRVLTLTGPSGLTRLAIAEADDWLLALQAMMNESAAPQADADAGGGFHGA